MDSLARGISEIGRIPYLGELQLAHGGPTGARGGNSAYRLAGVWDRLVVGPELEAALAAVQGQSVMLIDDLVDSRWTVTVAGRALRQAGAGRRAAAGAGAGRLTGRALGEVRVQPGPAAFAALPGRLTSAPACRDSKTLSTVLASIRTAMARKAPRNGAAWSCPETANPSKIRISRAATAMPAPAASCTRVADTVFADVSWRGRCPRTALTRTRRTRWSGTPR